MQRSSEGFGLRQSTAALAFTLFAIAPALQAAAPTLDHLYPIAIPRGATSVVTAIGKFDPWPPKIWLDTAGIAFKSETNAGRFTTEVATDAALGPHLIRAWNDSGVSSPRLLVITDSPQLAEQEPNDDWTKPQRLETFPAHINGRLDKANDVDSYAMHLKAGATLAASLQAHILASPVDAVLRLVDPHGVEVAFNNDDGRSFDPQILFTSSCDAEYVLQVFGFAYPADSSIRFTGSDKCVYRLHLELDPASAPPLEGKSEAEPNNTIAQANPVAVPSTNLGCINISGDEDCFSFSAKKGEKLKLEVQTAALGFPLDSWLKILDATGKQLVRDDDSETADPSIDWTAPEDGKFIAVVGNLLHRGGTNYLYRFLIDHPAPSYAPTVAEHAFTVTAGKTNQVKVSIRRIYGHTGKIKARITDLPDTVQCEADETGETASDLTLRLTAAADAKPFGGPVRVILTEPDGKERPALYRLVSKGEDNGVPQGYSRLLIESTENLWLTVLPAK